MTTLNKEYRPCKISWGKPLHKQMTAIPKAITEKGENLIPRVITLYNIQTVGFSTKNYRTFKKKQENTVFAEKEEFCRNCPWGIQELLVKGCKSTLSNMLKELQEIKRMLREWIANVNKNTILKIRNQIENLEFVSIVTETGNSIRESNDRFEHARERISKPEYKAAEIIQTKEHNEKII